MKTGCNDPNCYGTEIDKLCDFCRRALRRGSKYLNNEEKIKTALILALECGQYDGEHHKMWVIDQMVRALLGDEVSYECFVRDFCDGEDGPETYYWETGIAP